MMGPTIHPDPLDYDPFDGDELLSEPHDPPEPSELVKRAIIALATRDRARYDQEQAARAEAPTRPAERVIEPHGRRQREKRQRRALFDALRRGRGRAAACEAAGIDLAKLIQWMARPSFAEAVHQAEGYDHLDEDGLG